MTARTRKESAQTIAERMIDSYTSTHDVHDIMESCSDDFEELMNAVAHGERPSKAKAIGKLEELIKAHLSEDLKLTLVKLCDLYGEDSLHYAQAGFLLGLAMRGAR